MALAIGFLLFVLGVVALVAWWSVVLPVLAGALVFVLLFGGLIGMLVGYSEIKAKRELETGYNDKPSAAETPFPTGKASTPTQISGDEEPVSAEIA